MGGVLSKGKAAASAGTGESASAAAPAGSNPELVNEHDARTVEVAQEDTSHQVEEAQLGSGGMLPAMTSGYVEGADLPPDMQFIMESGLHEEPAEGATSSIKGQQGSIQDAVNDIKAKYNLNQPVADGELERIRKEIELKTRLMAMREAAQQRRMAVQAAEASKGGTSGEQQKLYKVDVKGKGRVGRDAEASSSSEDEAVSSDEESDSGSSSSSGLSLDLKPPARRGQQQPKRSDSDDGDSDDESVTGKLKPEEIAQAAAAFASQHEVVNPSIPPPPVDTLPDDAPLRAIGRIDHIINSVIVIRADINTQESMKGQILDEGSLLCLGDRRVLGAIFETFGSVHAPYYSIRLPPDHQLVVKMATSDGAESKPVEAGMQVFYSPTPNYSGLLFTRDIQRSQLKGSDASNLYDEEVGENEIEFSDDEQEVAYRRDLKLRKKERWAERQQDAQADNAEFEFDENFDDAASARSATNHAHGSKQDQESEEEGAIKEANTNLKRRLSASMGSINGGEGNKLSRLDGPSAGPRERGARPERGRGGRGRGAHAGNSHPRGGRGTSRGGGERGRGRGQSRGSGRGTSSNYGGMQRGQPSLPNGVPPRPAYQHPDALPYDDIPSSSFRQPRSLSPIRPHHSLPPRPVAGIEPYDPSVPHGQPHHPPRGMTALPQPWSPQATYAGDHVPYVPTAPYSPNGGQQYPQAAFPGSFGYQPAYQQQTGHYQQGVFPGLPMAVPFNQYTPAGSNFDPSKGHGNDASVNQRER